MLSSRYAIHSVLSGLSRHMVAQTVGLSRNFTSPAVRRFRAKVISSTNRNTPVVASKASFSFPHTYQEMDNATLVTLSAMKIHGARIEILKRHIMTVDRCSYNDATKMVQKIAEKNREGMALAAFPYQIGMFLGVSSAIASIPLVFDLSTSLWFNHHFVTTSIPEPHDLETMLEVGSWAWNWMEPPLGTLSFALLALQFSRAQMDNLGIRPYTAALKKRRGRYLAAAFPQYVPQFVIDFSETDHLMKIGR